MVAECGASSGSSDRSLVSSRKDAACNYRNNVCQRIVAASTADSGLAALEGLCDKCRKDCQEFGKDPGSQLPPETLKAVLPHGRSRFRTLEHELVEISEAIIQAIQKTGDNTQNVAFWQPP